MKFKLSFVLSMVLVLVMIFSSMTIVSAADNATVNGISAPVGSEVEYSFYIQSDVQKIAGIQMVFVYDQSVLAVQSVEFPSLPDAVVNNDTVNGIIYFNNAIYEGMDVSKKAEIAKVKFEVKNKGVSDISYYVQYLYDYDLIDLYDYTFTCSLKVNGQTSPNVNVPLLADLDYINTKASDFDKGDFENTADGIGSGIKPTYSDDNWSDIDDNDYYDDFEDEYDNSYNSDSEDFSSITVEPGVTSGRAFFMSVLSIILVIMLSFGVFI